MTSAKSEDHARASELQHSSKQKVSDTLPEVANEGATCAKLEEGAELRVLANAAVSSQ